MFLFYLQFKKKTSYFISSLYTIADVVILSGLVDAPTLSAVVDAPTLSAIVDDPT